MSIIDDFVKFHQATDPARRAEIDNVMKMLMLSKRSEVHMTEEQLAEDDRRFEDPDNIAVPHETIEAIAGMKMPS